MTALTRREKQQRTRRSLLRAAETLFCKQGLEAASVEQVAQEAGFTKGAFYANFKSKEELFLVMLDEKFAEEFERLDRALAGGEEPLAEAQAAAADFIHFASDERWPRLYFQFMSYAAHDEDFRQELATRIRAMRARLTELFTHWKEGFGKTAPIPQADITAMMFFMADGFLVDRLIEPELSEELYTTMIGIFLRGLQALAEEQESQGSSSG